VDWYWPHRILSILSILIDLPSRLSPSLSPMFSSVIIFLFVFYIDTACFSFHFYLHFMSLISTTDDLGGSYRRFRCPSMYMHELSPADDCRCPPFLAPGTSMLNLSRSEASSTRGPDDLGFCPSFLPEDGRRSNFQNVVVLLKYRRWSK
jgi:hypothetical protein